MLIERVVHLPEFALPSGCLGGQGRAPGVGVHIRKGKVAKHKLQLVAQRLLGLLPTPRECSGAVAELFTKADSRVRKIIVQGVVKEFEDSSRAGVKTEVANVGKVVLGGLT